MRAKTKKNLILQLVVIAIILPLLIWWHPVGPYRVIIKWGAIALAGVLYAVLDSFWKWKAADEDEKPLWFEKKTKNDENTEQPEESEKSIETEAEVETQAGIISNNAESSTSSADNNEDKDRTNFWLIVLISALALLMILAVILVINRKSNTTRRNITYSQYMYDSNDYNDLNETEQKILGKWDNSWSEDYVYDEDESEYPWLSEVVITQVSKDEFKSDKTENEEGSIMYKYALDFNNAENYYYAVLEYAFRYEGVWYADNDNLFLKGTDVDYKLVRSYFIGDVGDLDEDYYLGLLKDMQEREFIDIRKEAYKQRNQKILDLSDTELKVELEDGEVMTETRII